MRLKLLLLTIFLTANLQAQNGILNYLQNAKSNSKQSVLLFYRADCPYCLKMDHAISKDESFKQSLKNNFNVILVDINSTEGKSLAAQYKVKGVPSIIKLDNETNLFKIQNGFNSTAKLAGFLGMTSIPDAVMNKNNAGTVPICGNGLIEAGEQCDDGNSLNGDGCSTTCQIEGPVVCGNGVIQAGEQCDDGNTANGDGCSATCQFEVSVVCGNGIIQAGEQCDDGNTVNGDGCSATCQVEEVQVCGNGIVQAGEQCDDGNTINGDGCSATCQVEGPIVCGNGVIQAGEQCDDGNTVNGDGCNATCQLEASAPNDNCDGAVTLTIGSTFETNAVIGTTFGATTSPSLPTCQTNAFFDTWYKVIVPASGSVTVETRVQTDIQYVGDTVLTVYSGNCGALTEIGCNDDADGLMSLVNVSEQTPGTTLYVAVWTYGDSADNQGVFQISAYDVQAPANDLCANATLLTVGGTFETSAVNTSSTGGTTSSSIVPSCQDNAYADTWYQIVVPPSGTVTIETQVADPEELYDSVLAVYSGTCGTLSELDCNDDGGTDNNSLMAKVELTGQTPGATLLVGVWKYGTNTENSGAFKVAAYDASLSNPSFDNASLSMYPNPVKDVLNISYSKTISKVQVYSILGQEVITKPVNENQNQIDMSSLASGAYFVKVTSDGLIKTLKIIKE